MNSDNTGINISELKHRIDELERQVNDLYTAIGALKVMSEINHAQIQLLSDTLEKMTKR